MNESDSILHGIGVCLPFGVMIGVLLAPARVSGVDFRQWFRDPGQPSAYSDDSWIGLTIQGVAIAFVSAVGGVLLLGLWLAWPFFGEWRACCVAPGVGQFLAYLAPYGLGLLAGIALAQLVAELAWRFGLAFVPDALPPARLLSATTQTTRPNSSATVGRRLIVCCDGTWNWPDRQRETNVVRLVRAIAAEAKPDNRAPIPQISHYHLGVGTGNVLDRIVGGGIGVGLSSSVKACYGFLVDNYVRGDEIFLFGFSRGAYVARSVAGMIGSVGLLQRSEMERFVDAWDWYTDDRGQRQVADLDRIAPKRFREDVDIECIGVWDTVGALGIPGTRFCADSFKFHETELGAGVRYAFQALAMDERRGNFQAAVWTPNPAPPVGAAARAGVVSGCALEHRRWVRTTRPVRYDAVVDALAPDRAQVARTRHHVHRLGARPRGALSRRRPRTIAYAAMASRRFAGAAARRHHQRHRADPRKRLRARDRRRDGGDRQDLPIGQTPAVARHHV